MHYYFSPSEAEVQSSSPTSPRTKNRDLVIIGYIQLLLSAACFAAWEYYSNGRDTDPSGPFWIHYGLLIIYVIVLWYNDAFGVTRCWKKENMDTTLILLNLALVSAYALNRWFAVFDESVDWLCVYIIVSSVTMLSYRYRDLIPARFRALQHFLLGTAVVLYLYLTLYTLPGYLFGAIGFVLLGVGGHIFLPAALLTACFYLVAHHRRHVHWRWFAGGALAVVLFIAAFVIEWNGRAGRIEQAVNQSVLHPDQQLPVWARLAQTLRHDWITMRLLKADIVYKTTQDFGGLRIRNWAEAHRHDPLVFISALTRKTALSKDDRIKALEVMADAHHQGQERLWRGNNLSTSYIVSDVDIYPALRLAYTEKYLSIRNSDTQGWGSTQEAIYTFQLPEGAVVTSLSLWIGGQEQKAILTSKGKATEAYRNVVGVERRDPSVVHWQEGNTITLRVFPCTPDEERKVKIGITSPLVEEHGELSYRSMTFQGPASGSARETYRIRFPGYKGAIDMPRRFTRLANGDYLAEGDYEPDFELTLAAPAVPENHFNLGGYTYALAAYRPEYIATQFRQIYLDINATWTQTELYQLQPILKGFPVYVFTDAGPLQLEDSNWMVVTEKLRKLNFSLFPFHELKDETHTLVITKGKALSPHLSDISESNFAEGARQYMAQGRKAMVFNLGGDISTYISSLREFRAVDFAQGDLSLLEALLARKAFPVAGETAEKVVLHDAGLVITKTKTGARAAASNTPDHLARLFAYNDVMRKVGARYFADDFLHQDLVDEAAAAYVVSPVSSLIVLETQADYERFSIKDVIPDGLHNAAKDSQGAVPEPHEWALIILFLLFVTYTLYRHFQPGLTP